MVMKGLDCSTGGDKVEDDNIIELYWTRSENAIEETHKKYGRYCHTIAYNILYSNESAEECVNDTYVNAWNSIPPNKPKSLKYFLASIVRNLALNRYDYNNAQKRSGTADVIVDEFCECTADKSVHIEDEFAVREAINDFLKSLNKQTRIIFMRRYWYFCSVNEIAESEGLSVNNVKVILYRTRNKFRTFLEKEGIIL